MVLGHRDVREARQAAAVLIGPANRMEQVESMAAAELGEDVVATQQRIVPSPVSRSPEPKVCQESG